MFFSKSEYGGLQSVLHAGNSIFVNYNVIIKRLFSKYSDKIIIEGIKNQDDKTLNWLYDNFYQSVKTHIISNSGCEDDVSDVFQDAIIILYNQIRDDKLTLTTELKGYFFGIARNIWNSNLRNRKKTTGLDLNMPDEQHYEEANDIMFERIAERAFNKLKPEFKAVLFMFSEGFSYEEIASKLNLKSETYARRKKYLSKEALIQIVREDPEYQEYLRFRK